MKERKKRVFFNTFLKHVPYAALLLMLLIFC